MAPKTELLAGMMFSLNGWAGAQLADTILGDLPAGTPDTSGAICVGRLIYWAFLANTLICPLPAWTQALCRNTLASGTGPSRQLHQAVGAPHTGAAVVGGLGHLASRAVLAHALIGPLANQTDGVSGHALASGTGPSRQLHQAVGAPHTGAAVVGGLGHLASRAVLAHALIGPLANQTDDVSGHALASGTGPSRQLHQAVGAPHTGAAVVGGLGHLASRAVLAHALIGPLANQTNGVSGHALASGTGPIRLLHQAVGAPHTGAAVVGGLGHLASRAVLAHALIGPLANQTDVVSGQALASGTGPSRQLHQAVGAPHTGAAVVGGLGHLASRAVLAHALIGPLANQTNGVSGHALASGTGPIRLLHQAVGAPHTGAAVVGGLGHLASRAVLAHALIGPLANQTDVVSGQALASGTGPSRQLHQAVGAPHTGAAVVGGLGHLASRAVLAHALIGPLANQTNGVSGHALASGTGPIRLLHQAVGAPHTGAAVVGGLGHLASRAVLAHALIGPLANQTDGVSGHAAAHSGPIRHLHLAIGTPPTGAPSADLASRAHLKQSAHVIGRRVAGGCSRQKNVVDGTLLLAHNGLQHTAVCSWTSC